MQERYQAIHVRHAAENGMGLGTRLKYCVELQSCIVYAFPSSDRKSLGTHHSSNQFMLIRIIFHRFTRPENLGSESKIRCSKCRSYQVRNYPFPSVSSAYSTPVLLLQSLRMELGDTVCEDGPYLNFDDLRMVIIIISN